MGDIYFNGSELTGTHDVNFNGVAMDNVYLTDKDTKITAADGHWEITFTATVLPRDFHGPEFKD